METHHTQGHHYTQSIQVTVVLAQLMVQKGEPVGRHTRKISECLSSVCMNSGFEIYLVAHWLSCLIEV